MSKLLKHPMAKYHIVNNNNDNDAGAVPVRQCEDREGEDGGGHQEAAEGRRETAIPGIMPEKYPNTKIYPRSWLMIMFFSVFFLQCLSLSPHPYQSVFYLKLLRCSEGFVSFTNLSLSFCVPFFLCVSLSLSISPSLYFNGGSFVSFSNLSLSVCLSTSFYLNLYLCISLSLFIFISLYFT